jgi:hypothetical protein
VYYLLKPDAAVLWSDASEFMIQRLQKDHPELAIDLRRLDWQPAERRFDAGLLHTALRYGIAVGDGVIVSGQALVPLDYFRSMEAIEHKEVERDSTKLAHADMFEALMPGWKQSTRELDDRVRAAQRATVQRAQREMLAAFSKPIDPALSGHWQNLGGSIPPQPPTS